MKHGKVYRWWEVWLAPQEVRDARELLRHRMGLVETQTKTKNRIHALLHRHGIISECSDLFGVGGRRMLSLLVDDKESLWVYSHTVPFARERIGVRVRTPYLAKCESPIPNPIRDRRSTLRPSQLAIFFRVCTGSS